MAGPGFDFIYRKDPKEAAQNVQCIHTSFAGTQFRDCHQNWLMGYCGKRQPGGNLLGLNSHSLCPYFYISAFENDFLVNDIYHCPRHRQMQNVSESFKMGYMEDRKR